MDSNTAAVLITAIFVLGLLGMKWLALRAESPIEPPEDTWTWKSTRTEYAPEPKPHKPRRRSDATEDQSRP